MYEGISGFFILLVILYLYLDGDKAKGKVESLNRKLAEFSKNGFLNVVIISGEENGKWLIANLREFSEISLVEYTEDKPEPFYRYEAVFENQKVSFVLSYELASEYPIYRTVKKQKDN